MAAIIDTSRFVKIPYHRGKLVRSVFICVLLFAAGVWMGIDGGPRHSGFTQFIGWATAVLCGTMGVVYFRRMLRLGTYLTLAPKGFRIGEKSADLIAWTGVTAIAEQRIKLSKYLELSLTPDAAAQVVITPLAGLLGRRKPPAAVVINAQSAAVSHDELFRLVQAYFQAHGGRTAVAANSTDPSSRLVRQS
jgi:hypothetical protein